jgi:hypothetical protein
MKARRGVRGWGSHIFQAVGSQVAVRVSALGLFLVLISVRAWVDPWAILWLEGLGKLKQFSDLIGNRTRGLPACSIVPQATTLPHAPCIVESKLGPLGTSAIYWPIVPAPGDCEDGEFDGMNGRGNRSTRRKPALAPLCQPQVPLDQTRAWTRAAAVGSQRLTASAIARLPHSLTSRVLLVM